MSVFSVARGCEGFHLRVYGDGPVLSDVKRYFRPDAESGQAAWALPGNDMRTISPRGVRSRRSEEHTSELQSLMRISYAVFCLKKKIITQDYKTTMNYRKDT